MTTDIITTDLETRVAIFDSAASLPKPDNVILLAISAFLTFACLGYTFIHLDWGALEAAKFVGGVVLLWGPFAVLIFVLVRVSDFAVRLIMSLLASYALTALIYFGLAVFNLDVLFPVLQGAVVVGVVIYVLRTMKSRPDFRKTLRFRNINWFLLLIIAASMAVSVPREIPYAVDKQTLSRTALFYFDHLYETALSYELARHTPPLQAATAGGLPERAYHMFPHMTTMLIARYTAQEDMFRAHLVYHYLVIEVLLCLALYAIGKVFTATRGAGYVGALSMYLLIMSFPPIVANPVGYFYFTLFPQASSGLDPVSYTSPQMYSSMIVAFGVLLGIALLSRDSFTKQIDRDLFFVTSLMVGASKRFRIQLSVPGKFEGQVNQNLLFVTALMVGASTRFRIQFLLAALPAFLLTMVWLFIRRRKWSYVFAGAIALGVTGLLYLEMTSPIYLPGTVAFRIGLNKLALPGGFLGGLFNSWPFEPQVYDWLSHRITDATTFSSVWQVFSMSLFIALNVVGIPLTVATVFLFLVTKIFRKDFAIYRLFSLLLIGASVGISLFITMDYDTYSVPGQTTFQVVWYLMPIGALAIWLLVKQSQKLLSRLPLAMEWSVQDERGKVKWRDHLHWSSSFSFVFTAIVVIGMQTSPSFIGPSGVQTFVASGATTIYDSQYQGLLYIRANTPPKSIILNRNYLGYGNWSYAMSGLTGRAAYLEANTVSSYAAAVNSQDRLGITSQLWVTTSTATFCTILRTTPITHIVVYSGDPLQVNTANTPCLKQFWISKDKSAVTFAVQPIPDSLYF